MHHTFITLIIFMTFIMFLCVLPICIQYLLEFICNHIICSTKNTPPQSNIDTKNDGPWKMYLLSNMAILCYFRYLAVRFRAGYLPIFFWICSFQEPMVLYNQLNFDSLKLSTNLSMTSAVVRSLEAPLLWGGVARGKGQILKDHPSQQKNQGDKDQTHDLDQKF